MGNVSIQYHDIALGALPNSTPKVTSEERAELLSNIKDFPALRVQKEKIACFEPNSWMLNGDIVTIKEKPSFISNLPSNDEGKFPYPTYPVIEFKLDKGYTVKGLTISFGTGLMEYCTKLRLSYYLNGNKIKHEYFYPSSKDYFCDFGEETTLDRIKIELHHTALPRTRARITSVAFGKIFTFDMDSIRKATLQVEGDLVSNSLSSSTLSWTVDSPDAPSISFKDRQPVYTYDGSDLLSVTYLSKVERVDKNVYNIKNEDLFGVLDRLPFKAHIYNSSNTISAIKEILPKGINFPISNPTLSSLTGYIPNCSRREALRQILFALRACGTTFRTSGIRILDVLGAKPLIIPSLEREDIFTGQKYSHNEPLASVTVVSHTLSADPNGDVEINGVKYKDIKKEHTKLNPDKVAQERGRAVRVENMTLVNESNVDTIMKTLYNYLMLDGRISTKVVFDGRDIGETVDIPIEWADKDSPATAPNREGIISSMTVHLSHMTVADIKAEVIA